MLSVQCSVFSELPSVQCAQCSAAKTACNAVFNVKYMLSTKTAPDAVSIVNNEQDACSAQYALCSIKSAQCCVNLLAVQLVSNAQCALYALNAVSSLQYI